MNDQIETIYQQLDRLIKDIDYEHFDREEYKHLIKEFNKLSLIVERYAKIQLCRFLCSFFFTAFYVYALGLCCRILMYERDYVLVITIILSLAVTLISGCLAYLQWYLYTHTRENCKYIKQLRISFNYGKHRRTGQSNS